MLDVKLGNDFFYGFFHEDGGSIGKLDLSKNDSLCCNEMCHAGHFPILPTLLESIQKVRVSFEIYEPKRKQMNEKLQINSISNYTFSHYANIEACSHFLLNLKQ